VGDYFCVFAIKGANPAAAAALDLHGSFQTGQKPFAQKLVASSTAVFL